MSVKLEDPLIEDGQTHTLDGVDVDPILYRFKPRLARFEVYDMDGGLLGYLPDNSRVDHVLHLLRNIKHTAGIYRKVGRLEKLAEFRKFLDEK